MTKNQRKLSKTYKINYLKLKKKQKNGKVSAWIMNKMMKKMLN